MAPHVFTRVDGKMVAEIRKAKNEAGRLALHIFHTEGAVHFRKVEIKELPPY